METTTSSRPLAVESFSDSWLSNARPSLIDIIEIEETTNSFYFDTSNCCSNNGRFVVHADEIFSNGLIKPIFSEEPSNRTISTVGSSSHIASSPRNNIAVESDVQMGCYCCLFRRRSRFLGEKVLQRLFGYIIGRSKLKKSSTKVDDIDRRTMEVKSLNNSPQKSPINSPSSYYNYDVESSIQEAVLHCKRSIGR